MRAKSMKTVITFASTADAMAMEAQAKDVGIPGRIIPVPSQISAGCGMAWSVEADGRQELLDAIERYGIAHDGVYEVEMY